jgi:amidophosphoribosyltransferase
MCGILGMIAPNTPHQSDRLSADLYRGGVALQHRGQDGAGITTFSDRFHHHRGLGLIADVFRGEDLGRFKGNLGLTHLRYATAGVGSAEECQPFMVSYPYGLALIHNGNLTNDQKIRERLERFGQRHVNSYSDSESILHVFAHCLTEIGVSKHLDAGSLMRAAQMTMATIEGAYSVIILIAGHGLLAFRDPLGLRPLCYGQKPDGTYVLASESVALDTLDAEFTRDIAPGEAVFFDLNGDITAEQLFPNTPRHCLFEYIYLARPESVIDGQSVSQAREKMGEALAKTYQQMNINKATVAFDVPSSAEDAAVAFARSSGIPYRKGIRKNQYSSRSFIAASDELRKGMVGMKFLFEKRVVSGANVAVIDDSIVRGTTARTLLSRLKKAGVGNIHFFSAAPPIKYPCVYGIDMAIPQDLIANQYPIDQLSNYFGVDYLQYATVQDVENSVGCNGFCNACFTGEYPTTISDETLIKLGAKRQAAGNLPGGYQDDRIPEMI